VAEPVEGRTDGAALRIKDRLLEHHMDKSPHTLLYSTPLPPPLSEEPQAGSHFFLGTLLSEMGGAKWGTPKVQRSVLDPLSDSTGLGRERMGASMLRRCTMPPR
jgi:hypothetical protein